MGNRRLAALASEEILVNISEEIDAFRRGTLEIDCPTMTLRQVRAVDKDSKLAAEDIRHFQELTTSVLVPQLNHERTFFYDPSSR